MADLSRFKDTKNLDVNKILQMLAEHKVKVMVAGFAMAAVIGSIMIFNGYRAQAVEHQMRLLPEARIWCGYARVSAQDDGRVSREPLSPCARVSRGARALCSRDLAAHLA